MHYALIKKNLVRFIPTDKRVQCFGIDRRVCRRCMFIYRWTEVPHVCTVAHTSPACAVLGLSHAAHQDVNPAFPESELVYKSATTRRRMGYKRHPMIYGPYCSGRPEAHTRPLPALTPTKWISHLFRELRTIYGKRKTSTSLEVCIDPDSHGMTASVALYTPGFLRDPSENGKRTTENVFYFQAFRPAKW